jgi:mycofactocin glycosyltransferase
MTTRPSVSVVIPFAGSTAAAAAVVTRFGALTLSGGDELIIADNSGTVATTEMTVVRASGEASASHARNAGAAAASCDWILFLDSDVYPPADLIDAFFAEPIADEVGAITGDIHGIPDTSTLAARYGTARNFLGQRSHVMNPYRPRASSANLLVRRAAFDQVGGYTEGIWAAEDTDFTWRLQEAGWTLAFNEHAVVRHEYRTSLRALGRQWRGYAAGAAWLSRRYPDFHPDPGLNRLARILLKKIGIGDGVAFRADGRSSSSSAQLSRAERLQFLLINCYLGVEEQIGLRMSNEVKRAR